MSKTPLFKGAIGLSIPHKSSSKTYRPTHTCNHYNLIFNLHHKKSLPFKKIIKSLTSTASHDKVIDKFNIQNR